MMPFLNWTLTLAVLCLLTARGQAVDTRAQEQCRALHHTDVDDHGTEFLSEECQLNCAVHGTVTAHYLNEDGPCPGEHAGVCHKGHCIIQTGFIDVEINSVSVAKPINAFVNVCIRNHSDPIPFPLTENLHCASCTTEIIPTTTLAVWNKICTVTSKTIFSSQARVAFEVGDHHGPKDNYFIGGTSLTVPQLLSHGDSNKQLHLAIIGGHVAGQINARVTWTPRN